MKTKNIPSPQIEKTRQKLKKILDSEHKKFSTKALRNIAQQLRASLVKQHPEWASLKNRNVALFDENRHSAAPQNKKIVRLLKKKDAHPS